MIPIWLTLPTLPPLAKTSGSSVCLSSQCVVCISQSPLTTLVASNRRCFSQVMSHLIVFVCANVLFFLCSCECAHTFVVIIRMFCCSLMTRALPGGWGCHNVVTNSLSRSAGAKTPAKPLCTSHTTHIVSVWARKKREKILSYKYTLACLLLLRFH